MRKIRLDFSRHNPIQDMISVLSEHTNTAPKNAIRQAIWGGCRDAILSNPRGAEKDLTDWGSMAQDQPLVTGNWATLDCSKFNLSLNDIELKCFEEVRAAMSEQLGHALSDEETVSCFLVTAARLLGCQH